MLGGRGNDSYFVDNAGDVVDETGGDGIDTVVSSRGFSLSSSFSVVGDIENLTLTGTSTIDGLGNALDNVITGNAGNNMLVGGTGNDTLNGGDGSDILTGGGGADKLSGGLNADRFVYTGLGQSTVDSAGRDTILDFSHAQGDLIDLSAIDANSTVAGDQAFNFISGAPFSHTAGELRGEAFGADTLVSGDVNGDGLADVSIMVKGVTSIVATDFVL
jgi:serralysin